jgi:hypothetical protein
MTAEADLDKRQTMKMWFESEWFQTWLDLARRPEPEHQESQKTKVG